MDEMVWLNGRLTRARDACVPITSDAVLRGINVFEGIMAYRRPSGGLYAVISLDQHIGRFVQSAALMDIPAPDLQRCTVAAIGELLALHEAASVYIRPMLYLERGYHDARSESAGFIVSARPVELPDEVRPLDCIVSPLRHISNAAYPVEAKVGAAYAFFRLSRIQAAKAGADEAILLSADGCVAETPGASIFAVTEEAIVTPPLTTGILPSITRTTAMSLLRSPLNMTVVERALRVSELHAAREVFVTGTLDEIRPVRRIDGQYIGNGESRVTARLREEYLRACTEDGVAGPCGTRVFRGR